MPSLTQVSERSRGLLHGDDRISLASSLSLSGTKLTDTCIQASYSLHPRAARALWRISEASLSASAWIDGMEKDGLSPRTVREIIDFLNRIGGLKVRRSLRGQADMLVRHAYLVFLGSTSQIATRTPADIRGICKAFGRAACPLLLSLVLFVGIAHEAGILTRMQCERLVILLAAVASSLLVHELGHVAALASLGKNPFFLQRGMRLGVLHGKLTEREGCKVALAGPIAGIFLLMPLCLALGLQPMAVLAIAALHFLSLLPMYGDGRAVTRYVLSLFK